MPDIDHSPFAQCVHTKRFTVDGDDRLEQHLVDVCSEVRTGVRQIIPESRLDGLILGGGYGRGEGGVLATQSGDRPYNDMEFYVFVHGSTLMAERRYRNALRELGHELEGYAGVEIEFKIVNRAKVERSESTMFFYDLVNGHRVVDGQTDLLRKCDNQRSGVAIPLHEATRLLMNRCSGLLFAMERLGRENFSAADADFVGRNIAKAELALGDVVLTAHNLYHHSVRKRAEWLRQLRPIAAVPQFEAIVRMHEKGTAFKLRPRCNDAPREELQAQLNLVSAAASELFLWLEGRRLHCTFPTVESYAFSANDKCPETPGWRNALVNMRAFGASGLREQPRRYPRGRLLETLPLLLWVPTALADERFSAHLARRLQSVRTNLTSAVAAYARLWERFQ